MPDRVLWRYRVQCGKFGGVALNGVELDKFVRDVLRLGYTFNHIAIILEFGGTVAKTELECEEASK